MTSILFVGTVPLKHPENTGVIFWDPNGIKIVAKGRECVNGSNFADIKQFLLKYSDEIGDYNFLMHIQNNETGMGNISELDLEYTNKIIDIDLSTVDKLELERKYDIVYIDTNTLGYINYKRTPYEWVDFFSPVVNKFLISDDEKFLPTKGLTNAFLSFEVYHEFTGRLGIFKSKFSQDFVKLICRHSALKTTPRLYKCGVMDMKFNMKELKSIEELNKIKYETELN